MSSSTYGGNNKNNNYESVGYPKLSDIQTSNDNLPNAPGPAPGPLYNQPPQQNYDKPSEKKKQHIKQNNPRVQTQQQMPQMQPQAQQATPGQIYMGPHGPQYAPYPVPGVQFIPVAAPYQMGYYPPQMYGQAYPYYGPPPMGPNAVVVLPPGYKRDDSAGYSPWGNFAEDLENLF